MRAPAATALLLAVLCALPCQGIDANTTTKLLNGTSERIETRPTLNLIYTMLHSELNNRTSFSFNHSLELNKLNTDDCCSDFEGANVANNDIRLARDLSVIRTNSEFSTRETRMETTTRLIPSALEKRKKMGESGSSAPLLNYIFDAYSNTHAHHVKNERPGPGNNIYAAAAPEIKALVGSTAHLDCKVDALHDKLVSWVRRKNDEEPMELLTTGTQQYTADDRYSARFIPPDIWRLEVRDVRPSDAAAYDCQLSAHPPRTARVTLSVPEVSVRIIDNAGADVSEQVCEQGSTVALRCEVRGLRMEGGPALLWYRRDDLLNDDTTRGGISVRTEFGANGANSVLRVARVRADDAGRYTCSVAHAPPVALPPAYVLLHVIKGESLAELHQGAPRLDASALTIALLTLYALRL